MTAAMLQRGGLTRGRRACRARGPAPGGAVIALVTILAVGVPRAESADPKGQDGNTFFERDVRPILVERCYSCHSGLAKKTKGGLNLDHKDGWVKGGDRGAAIEPGKPDESLLIQAVRYEDEDL